MKCRKRKIKKEGEIQSQEPAKRTNIKRIFEGREDGGPKTQSKVAPIQPISASYTIIVINEKVNLDPKMLHLKMEHPKMEEKTYNIQAQNGNKVQPKSNLEDKVLQEDVYLGAIKTDLQHQKG